jgi:hypothetical protein
LVPDASYVLMNALVVIKEANSRMVGKQEVTGSFLFARAEL